MKRLPLVVLGASLGGLDVVGKILSALPSTFSAPLVVVQHRAADDGSTLCRLLDHRSNLPVREPEDREPIRPGRVYLGPSDYHLLVDDEVFYLSTEGPQNYARPSIDALFESAADAHFAPLLGVLLTAASHDGAHGLLKIAQRGGTTIVQDPKEAESPVAVLAALRLGAAQHTMTTKEIAPALVSLVEGSAAARSRKISNRKQG